MADDHQTPLLSTYSSETAAAALKKEAAAAAAASSVEHTIESCIGPTGLRQLLQAILVSAAWIFDAQQTFINVFTDAQPNWHCTTNATCSSSRSSPCSLPLNSWDWDRPKEASIVSDFGLECSSPALVGLPASAFFLGCLAGGLILATLADSRLGRKNMLFLSCLSMSLAAALTALSPNLWVYSALRFLCGFGRATVGTCAIVLVSETVGRRWRDRISIVGFFLFTLGFLSLPAMAYSLRGSSWRSLYLWTSIPSFLYSLLVYSFATESPRWLLVRGRKDEAIDLLKSIAASNGNFVMSSFFSTLSTVEEDWNNIGMYSSMKILWEKKWALRRLTAVMTVGFGVGMVYYGMPLNVGNLSSDLGLYLSVTLNAVAELPSSLVIFFVIGRLKRRCSLLVLTTASGVCSVLCAVLAAEELQMAAEVVSFFSACTAFNVLLIYSIELFPTCVRNSAMSMVRQALVLGGVFAPLLVAQGRRKMALFLSFGVFGLVIGCCGLFAATLPETRGSTISDTLEEEEHKVDDNNINNSTLLP